MLVTDGVRRQRLEGGIRTPFADALVTHGRNRERAVSLEHLAPKMSVHIHGVSHGRISAASARRCLTRPGL